MLRYTFNTGNATSEASSGSLTVTGTSAGGASVGADGSGLSGLPGDRALRLGASWSTPRLEVAQLGLSPALSSFTVCGWLKQDVAPSTGFRIFDAGGTGASAMLNSSGTLDVGVVGYTAAGVGSGFNASGSWVFFAITYENSTNAIRVYRGTSASAATQVWSGTRTSGSATASFASGVFNFGNSQGNNRSFAGWLDDVRLYGATSGTTGALDATQIEAIRSGVAGGPRTFKADSDYWEQIDTELNQSGPPSGQTTYGGWGAVTVQSASPTRQSLVAFSSIIGNGRIPPGSTIQSARLRMYCNYLAGTPAVRVHRVLAPWNEAESVWGSLGGDGAQTDGVEAAAAATATVTPSGAGGWVEWDVTADVQAWANSGGPDNRGWLLATSTAGTAQFRTKDHSPDHMLWPELVVTMTPAPDNSAGTRTSDAAFFASMNLDYPGLSAVKAAVQSGNYAQAKTAYAAYLRTRALPEWFFAIPQPSVSSQQLDTNSTAEKSIRREFTLVGTTQTLPSPIDWRTAPSGASPDWQIELTRHEWFKDLAEAWSVTGNTRYPGALTAQLRSFINDMPPPALDLSETQGWVAQQPRTGWRTIDAGLRAGWYWPDSFVRVVRAGGISDDDLVQWVKSFSEHARFLKEFHQVGNNWVSFEALGVFTVGVLFPELQDAATWRATGMQRMSDLIINDAVYPDGVETELTPWYQAGILRYALRMAQLADSQGFTLPGGYMAAMEKMYSYLLNISGPNWTVPMLNDSEPMEARSWIAAATRLSDGTSLFPARADFEWIASNRASGSAPSLTSTFFPWAGQAVMRSDWENDGRVLLFEGGPFGTGHQQEDKLAIYLSAYGQELLTDSGRYLYDMNDPFRIYVMNARAHSTVEVDGKLQQRRPSFATYELQTPDPIDWTTSAIYDYVSAAFGEDSANEKYFTVQPTALNNGLQISNPLTAAHRRHLVFIKPNYWIVVDDLKPADSAAHTWRSLFQMVDYPYSVDTPTGRVTLQQSGRPSLTITPLNEGGLTTDVVRGAGDSSANAASILGWTTSGDGTKSPIPVARFTRTKAGRTQIAAVLHPAPAFASPVTPTITRLASSSSLFAARVTVSGQPQIDVVINLDYATAPDFQWQGFTYTNRLHLILRDGVPVDDSVPSVQLDTIGSTVDTSLGTTPAWRLTRFGGDTTQPLTVDLQAGGTAQAGTDFSALPASVTIPANQAQVTIPLTPIPPASPGASRTVSLATPQSAAYTVASTAGKTITLSDRYAGPATVDFYLLPGATSQQTLTVANTTGAPVTYATSNPGGYSFSSSKQQGGPVLDWQDISTTGTEIDTSTWVLHDDAMSMVSFGSFAGQAFTFPFYGNTFTSARVSTNGFLTFDIATTATSSFINSALPNASGSGSSYPWPNLIALLWDDLLIPKTSLSELAPNGTLHTKLVDADTFIIQFTNAKPYSQLGGGDERFTGQIVLKRDGTIRLNYKSFNFGQDTATVGIQNGARNQALQLAYNQPFVTSNLAVQILPPTTWLATSATSAAAAAGGTAQFTVTANAAGLAAGDTRTYNDTITPSGGGQPALVVPVRLHVLSARDAWKYQALGAPATPGDFSTGIHADNADPDGDSLTNFAEYALGSNPAVPSTSPASQWQTDRLALKFLRARSDLTYIVEGSSDLAAWQPVATNPGTVGTEVTQPDAVLPNPRRFLRLRITSP